jgi:preprotein translocase subunit SecG
MVHSPKDVRFASYSYFANVYSLLISGMVSMLRSQLTQNDAIFVIIATASPATLYLWAISAVALFTGLPQRYQSAIPNKREQAFIVLLAIVSFMLWIVSIGLYARPSSGAKFSQPGCNKIFGRADWISLLWSTVFLVRTIFLVVSLLLTSLYLKLRMRRRNIACPGTP